MTMKPNDTEEPAAPVSEGGGELADIEIIAGLERIERTMHDRWDDYGVDILHAARSRLASLSAAEARAKEAEALQRFKDYVHLHRLDIALSRATRAESERDEALRALEPFARVGEVFLKTSDDILVPWGTPDGTRVDLFQASAVTREVITAGDMRRAALLSRLQSGNMRQQEVREQSEAERAPESGEGPV